MLNQKTVVKVKKLNPQAQIPKYMTLGSGAVDLYATEIKNMPESMIIEYKTGLAFQIPEGHMGLIYPRSSISTQTTLILSNCVGIIDSDYLLEVSVRFRPMFPSGNKIYKVGDRIAQLVVVPYPKIEFIEFNELNDPGTRKGGFGSTNEQS